MGEWTAVGPENNRAYLVTPENGSGPGVLVLHAWWGLNRDVTDICDRLAKNGFVALAPDLYQNEATAETIAEAEALVKSHDNSSDVAETSMLAGLEHLLHHSAVNSERIGVVGFSLGAYWALHVSQIRPEHVCACVTVYGIDDGDYSTATAAYLGHFAEHDDYEPLDGVRDLEERIRSAGHDVSFHVYPGTGHWFVEPSRTDAYNPEAAELAWQRTVEFFNSHLS